MTELDGIQTDYECPECGSIVVYDVDIESGTANLVVHIYCENEECDYYESSIINPIETDGYY